MRKFVLVIAVLLFLLAACGGKTVERESENLIASSGNFDVEWGAVNWVNVNTVSVAFSVENIGKKLAKNINVEAVLFDAAEPEQYYGRQTVQLGDLNPGQKSDVEVVEFSGEEIGNVKVRVLIKVTAADGSRYEEQSDVFQFSG